MADSPSTYWAFAARANEIIDCQRVALQLKMNQMDQGPAHRQQWRFTSGGIEEIALAGRIEALDAVARVDFQLIAADDAA